MKKEAYIYPLESLLNMKRRRKESMYHEPMKMVKVWLERTLNIKTTPKGYPKEFHDLEQSHRFVLVKIVFVLKS